MDPYKVTGQVELFPQKGGWHYLSVPKKVTNELQELADRGLIPITATLGDTSWDTSLLPMGDGTHFIALSAKVRQAEKVTLGDTVSLSFILRDR